MYCKHNKHSEKRMAVVCFAFGEGLLVSNPFNNYEFPCSWKVHVLVPTNKVLGSKPRERK